MVFDKMKSCFCFSVLLGVTITGLANAGDLPKLLDLGATACIPCKKMAPILEELKKEMAGQLEVEFIDVWKNANEAPKYEVTTIPTQIFFDKEGKEAYRHTGFMSEADIVSQLKKMGVD